MNREEVGTDTPDGHINDVVTARGNRVLLSEGEERYLNPGGREMKKEAGAGCKVYF